MRKIVYVHGACNHEPGFSDPWFAALAPYTTAYGDGILGQTRIEVVWSDLVQHELIHLGPWAGCFADFFQYLNNLSIRSSILACFSSVVSPLLANGDHVDIISHSEGTIVSYEGLRSISGLPSNVLNYFTVGAALSFAWNPLFPESNVRNHLLPQNMDGAKPSVVNLWWNLCCSGDPFGAALAPAYRVTQDFVNLEPVGCTELEPLCAHESYFNPSNVVVNKDIFATKINEVY